MLTGVSDMAASIQLINEADLNQAYRERIAPFWRQGEFSAFTGVDNIRINFARFEHPKTPQDPPREQEKKLVIVPGRCEGYLKYQELCYDFYHAGYDLYIIDHRGQGISQRLLARPHKGHVESFDHYSDDLQQFIRTIVKPNSHSKTYLLAHSMGAAISARYLQRFDNEITAAVFASPMIAINSGFIPSSLAKVLVKTGGALNHTLGKSPWYFPGQGDYQPREFTGNPLMHSAVRYQKFIDLYRDTPEIQLGGVTFRWLAEALKTRHDIFRDLARLNTPLTVLQAGADTIVDNRAQDEFCHRLNRVFPASCPAGKPVKITRARHELFFEADEFRNPALSQAVSWFERF